MGKLSNYKFSKIGTDPMVYFNNFCKYINYLPIGIELKIKGCEIVDSEVTIAKFNSPTTINQNIGAWVYMGFLIKKNKDTLIKVFNKLSEFDLLNISKYSLLQNSDSKIVNQHRKTIIIKLLTMLKGESQHDNMSYEEILKHCKRYEEVLFNDIDYVNHLAKKWGK